MAQLPIHGYAADNTRQVVAVSEIDDEILPLAQQDSWFMSGEYAATSVKGKGEAPSLLRLGAFQKS